MYNSKLVIIAKCSVRASRLSAPFRAGYGAQLRQTVHPEGKPQPHPGPHQGDPEPQGKERTTGNVILMFTNAWIRDVIIDKHA